MVCEAMEPLLLKSSSADLPRIVNVCSMAGTRRNVAGNLRKRLDELLNEEDATAALGELGPFFDAFPQAVKAGNHSQVFSPFALFSIVYARILRAIKIYLAERLFKFPSFCVHKFQGREKMALIIIFCDMRMFLF